MKIIYHPSGSAEVEIRFVNPFTLTALPAVLLSIALVRAGEYVPSKGNWEEQRHHLVAKLHAQGITDERVLAAIDSVPRHLFLPKDNRPYAYVNHAVPIDYDQTISQPYIVAYMCEALHLKDSDRVLEIGTGSGYHAAVMSLLAKEVYSIEIIPELGNEAAALLKELGYKNVRVRVRDGYLGWPDAAPYDAVIITAAPLKIPQPLLDQMATGGRLIAPIGEGQQKLILVEKTPDGIKEQTLIPVRFVPMTGRAKVQ